MLFKQSARYKVTYGGRGSSKSMGMGIGVIKYAIEHPDSKILCVRGTQTRISDSSLQILKDVIDMMGLDDYFEQTEHTLECKNGSDFLFYGAKAYQQFKSLQSISLCWIDEATELRDEAWEYLIPTIRSSNSEIWVSFNPEREDDWAYREFILNKRHDAIVLKLNYWDNPYFPEVLQKEMEWDKETNLSKYKHIWEGEIISAPEGALWDDKMIVHIDMKEMAKTLLDSSYERIVIGVDPAVTNKETSDNTGIVVAGKKDDEFYVLEDASGKYTTYGWAEKVSYLYEKWEADRVIGEVNQGGDLIESNLRGANYNISYRGVRAYKGKYLRAEPIASLYEQKRVKHIKIFIELEEEMKTFVPGVSKSPDRLDALVYAITELSTKKQIRTPAGMALPTQI